MSQEFQKRGKSQRGVTLVEVVLVSALASFLFLAIGEVMTYLAMSQRRIEENLATAAAEAIGARQTWYDIRKSSPSFNLITNVVDDAGLPFYDYVPDVPCFGTQCTRRLELTAGDGDSLVMLVTDSFVGEPIPLNPNTFYTSTVVDTTAPNVGGTLTFNEGDLVDLIRAQEPALTDDKRLLQFYSPRSMRPTGSLTLGTPMRVASFIGYVDGNIVEPIPSVAGLPTSRHPASGFPFANVDDFFQGLPPIGGKGAYALARAVKLVRYSVEPIQFEGFESGALMRETLEITDGGAQWSPRRVILPICGLEFVRSDITIPSIRATVIEDKNLLNRNRRLAKERSGGDGNASHCARNSSGEVILPNSLEAL